MLNFLDHLKAYPARYKQLAIDDQLVSQYNCPIEKPKETVWTTLDYFIYVIDGKKIWHTPDQSFEVTSGKCIFVKKGSYVVEQFFDRPFCFVAFFVSDRFIAETIRSLQPHFISAREGAETEPITFIDTDDTLHAFFNSVVPYFLKHGEASKILLELKFRELILNVVHNPSNRTVTHYFYSLVKTSTSEKMRRILEDNFYYNLSLEEYARLCGKSLSSFKRDFETYFKTTPGRWLLHRRLRHAQLLIHTSDKSISEVAFDSGFENVSHFSRAFKEQFGHSPVRYRQAVSVTV